MSNSNYELLKKGDPSAMVQIHAQYSRSIFWVGKRLIRDEFVIESLVQDVFLKLWLNKDRIESPKHIFYFLRFVMKRDCISYYSKPKHQFFRTVQSLERYNNYQDYMLGYDPVSVSDNLKNQELEQKAFEEITRVLPLLRAERRHLIQLCLTHGFQYKAIAEMLGTGITETSNDVKRAIADLKAIIKQGSLLETKHKPAVTMKGAGVMTQEQAQVLRLRKDQKLSFASIATALNLSQQEVHQAFITAYKLVEQNLKQPLESENYGKDNT